MIPRNTSPGIRVWNLLRQKHLLTKSLAQIAIAACPEYPGAALALAELLGPTLLPGNFKALIASDAGAAYEYAAAILQGPFSEGEVAIAVDGLSALYYATHVLHGPFPAGESKIAESPAHSISYARRALHGPFPLGEPAIANSKYCEEYYDAFYADNYPSFGAWRESIVQTVKAREV